MGALFSGLDNAASPDPTPDAERMMAYVEKHVADARIRLAHSNTQAATTGGYSSLFTSHVQIAYKRWPSTAIDGQPSCCGILCCGMCRACVEGPEYMNAIAARGGPVSTVMLAFPRGNGMYEWSYGNTMLIARATRRAASSKQCCPCAMPCCCCCAPSHGAGKAGFIRESYLTVSECASPDWYWREIACTQEEVDRMICFAYANRLAAFDEAGARHALVPEIRACCCPMHTLCCCCATGCERQYYCASFVYAVLCAGGGEEETVQRRLWANSSLVWHCPMDRITPTNLVGAIVTVMLEKTRTADGTPTVTYGANYITTPRATTRARPAFMSTEFFLMSSPSAGTRAIALDASHRADDDTDDGTGTTVLLPSSRV